MISLFHRKIVIIPEQEQQSLAKIRRFIPDPETGLTEEQAAEHFKAGAVNFKVDSSTKSVRDIIYSNVFTYFNFIFLVLAVLLIMVGSFRNLTFLPIILANTCIGIIQEIRAKKVLDQMALVNTPKVRVIRNGEELLLPADQLVLDDVVCLTAGNQVPADAMILKGEAAVNEALLTGESDEVHKKEKDSLLSGSFLVSGECTARLMKVGRNSYISRLTIEATKSRSTEQSEMIKELDRLLKIVGFLILPIGIILFVQQFVFARAGFAASITGMVAAVIGMIPEGLYLLASVAMAVSAIRLARQQVLLHDMKCIETLARVDVLCVDKTGTITVPEMEVDRVELLDPSMTEEKLRTLISDFCLNMTADNATMMAMQDYFTSGSGISAQKLYTFSSRTKYSAVCLNDVFYAAGAPEKLLLENYPDWEGMITRGSQRGYRMLLFGICAENPAGEPLNKPVQPLALIYLSNAIREGAKETFQYFADCGVEIKVLSGDHPGTVSEIAKKAGIIGAEKYVDASTLVTNRDIANAVSKYTVFGRVTPAQKLQFIHALKTKGRTVAMTGDGVNDVLALKNADCSIAMASGSEAAAQVSQLVLLDSDFSRMPSVVLEGRRVVNNIQRSASLFLVKNIFSMLTAVFSVIFVLNYPLEPAQISLISMFTIGIPSFILALESNKERISGRFLTNVLLKALPAGLTDFLVVSGLVVFCNEFQVDAECVSTSCTILVAIVGFMILYQTAQPMTMGHRNLLIGVVSGWLFCMLFIGHLFAITDITRQCAMLLVVFALITEPALRYLSRITRYLGNVYVKWRN